MCKLLTLQKYNLNVYFCTPIQHSCDFGTFCYGFILVISLDGQICVLVHQLLLTLSGFVLVGKEKRDCMSYSQFAELGSLSPLVSA